jgi:hypothetical protein
MKNAKQAFLASILKKGEHYAGIILGKDGAPDYHLILLPGQANDVTLQQAQEFATKTGGELPTRREQSLLYANLKEEFQERWYWSGEQHAVYSVYAWYQDFSYGYQDSNRKNDDYRARAVRRINLTI